MVNRFISFDEEDATSISEHQQHIDELMDMLGFDESEDEYDEKMESITEEEEETPIPVSDFLKAK